MAEAPMSAARFFFMTLSREVPDSENDRNETKHHRPRYEGMLLKHPKVDYYIKAVEHEIEHLPLLTERAERRPQHLEPAIADCNAA